MAKIETHHDIEVYQLAFEAAMRIFELTKGFPREEIYSLTDQRGVERENILSPCLLVSLSLVV